MGTDCKFRFSMVIGLGIVLQIILLIMPDIYFALASLEEQREQECRFSIKDSKGRTYEVYVSCLQSLDFETAESVVTVRYGSISSVRVTEHKDDEIKICVSLKDGQELIALHPRQSEFHLSGRLPIAGTLADVSVGVPWEMLHEMKSLQWQKPKESSIWKLEQEEAKECRFSFIDSKARVYEIYMSGSSSARFEVNNGIIPAVITVKFGIISSARIMKDDRDQVKVNICLKDGLELAELCPAQSCFSVDGKMLIAGMLFSVSRLVFWDTLQEIESLHPRSPEESSIWESLKPLSVSCSRIEFRNIPFSIPSKGISAYVRGQYNTRLSPWGVGKGIMVDEYKDTSIRSITVTIGSFGFDLPAERISQISQAEKMIILRNSQQILFDDVSIPSGLLTDTAIGRCLFGLNSVRLLEFADLADTAAIWDDPPEPELTEFEITDRSQKTYRTKQITTNFVVTHKDVDMRLLTGHYRDNYYVAGTRVQHIAYRDFNESRENHIPIKLRDAILLLDLRYVNNLELDSVSGNKVKVDLGKNRKLSGWLAGRDLVWEFNEVPTGSTVYITQTEVVSIRRIIKKRLEY